jgi:acetyltransferase-like isoleucine patch superfamily enzyme
MIFGELGHRTRIFKPLKIDSPKNICLGENVRIGRLTWLAANPIAKGGFCNLKIQDETYIGNFNHIYCTSQILIGKKVMTADKVYISDNLHGYENIELAISEQAITQLNPVSIGDGTWIGENSCIIGVTIGKGCVIGANSVVLKDIPDFCVVAGNPARIIRRFDIISKKWK